MKKQHTPRKFTRRDFLKLTGQGALLGLLGSTVRTYANAAAPGRRERGLARTLARPAAAPGPGDLVLRLVATDNEGVLLPNRADPLYVFGFRQVRNSDMVAAVAAPPDPVMLLGQTAGNGAPIDDLDVLKGQVQWPSPVIGVNVGQALYLTLTNIGFVGRPDLDDSHTIHWHGFRNPVSLFDGVPEVSIAVPPGRDFSYFYRPEHPGTYMYHCHFEDSEHVQMGMDGIVYVNPTQNGTSIEYPTGSGKFYTKFAYQDGDGSTGYDRHWTLLLNEVDQRPHDNLIGVQEFVWSDYKPQYWIINGRAYPDTIKPNQDPSLPQQPLSSLIQINSGERGLLRFVNLGYEQHTMQMTGITMNVVGEDATHLRGPGGTSLYYDTANVYIGPGESRDVLFTAPPHSGSAGPDIYLLKNRNYHKLSNGGAVDPLTGLGGMVTEVRVYPAGTLGTQTQPNQTY
jgi:FtsP/CotA-like multicopper oxidase with cupredoxin domain